MFLERASSSSGATSGTSNHCRSNTFSWLWVTCGDTGVVCRGQAREQPQGSWEQPPPTATRGGASRRLSAADPPSDVTASPRTKFLWRAGGSFGQGSHTLCGRPSAACANHFCFQRRFTEDTALLNTGKSSLQRSRSLNGPQTFLLECHRFIRQSRSALEGGREIKFDFIS